MAELTQPQKMWLASVAGAVVTAPAVTLVYILLLPADWD